MNYWLVKSEPGAYAWAQFVKDGHTAWTGVRNFSARLNLRAMKNGDFVCYYHSGDEKQVVGLARVSRDAYPDPTATEGEWVCVDLEVIRSLKKPVPLGVIRADSALKEMRLVKQSRLSVTPLTGEEFARVLELAETRI